MKRYYVHSLLVLSVFFAGAGTLMCGAALEEAAAKGISKEAMEAAGKSMSEAGMKDLASASAREMQESIAKSMDEATADLVKGSKTSLDALDTLGKQATKNMKTLSMSEADMTAAFSEAGEMDASLLTKDLTKMSDEQLSKEGLSEFQVSSVRQAERESSEVLGKGAGEGGAKTATKVGDASIDAAATSGKGATKELTESQAEEVGKMSPASKTKFDALSDADKEAYFKMNPTEKASFGKIADEEAEKALAKESAKKFVDFNAIKEGGVKGAAKFTGGKLLGITEVVGMAVLFMIPSIFESGFLAEQQRNALLETYGTPIKFGNIVLQIPDSEINVTDPTLTDFIYYGIPVDEVGNGLSADAAKMYPGVTGPSKDNPISHAMSNGYSQAMTFGGAQKSMYVHRYNLDGKALSTLPIFVGYSDQSWDTWGTTAITDPTFPQMLVNLDTGYVFYADGMADNTPAAPLVGVGQTKSVESYLSYKLGKVSSAGSVSSYTEYTDTTKSSKGAESSAVILNRFDCGCLSKNDGILSKDTLDLCVNKAKSPTCLLTHTLEVLSAGLILNADGKVLTADQNLVDEVAKGALGQVIPIQGLGDTLSDYLRHFPAGDQNASVNSNLTTSLGFGDNASASSDKPKVIGAAPDNYSAKGIYVYQCKNTPLAKILSGSKKNDYIYDYIVFLDEDLNQLPLMVPFENQNNYNFPTMQLNPDIAFFSTILGNYDDSSGTFSFVPQLNVSVHSYNNGKPFAPLYGLNAKNGQLSINVNQNLASKIGAIVQALYADKTLGEQFRTIEQAMGRLALQGPFGKYKLAPIDSSLTPNIGGTPLSVYTGYNAYPVNEPASNWTDVLIPVTATGSTVVLPSDKVAYYWGMVSDICYTVMPDGSIGTSDVTTTSSKGVTTTVSAFAKSPFSLKKDASGASTWAVDATKINTYNYLNMLASFKATVGGQPLAMTPLQAGASADPLTKFIQEKRAAWISWIETTKANPTPDLTGVAWGNRQLTLIGQQAYANSFYVYTCQPSPSSIPLDYFVLTDSKSPLANDVLLGSISATKAKPTTNILSLVTGLLYDSLGNQVRNSLGVAYQINGYDVTMNLYKIHKAGFSSDFQTNWSAAYNSYAAAQKNFVFPFSYGSLQVGIYQADLDICSYIYGDASGAGTTSNFKPKDYFVTYGDDKKAWAQQLSNSTQFVLSLVSGIVYGPTGPQYTLSSDKVAAVIAALSPAWRSSMASDITTLSQAYAAREKAMDDADAAAKASQDASTPGVTWKESDVFAMTERVKAASYVPAPYQMLKQDPVTKQYVQVSPAGEDGSDFMYTFFDVPNTYKDSNGNPVHVAGMFDSSGNQLYLFADLQLESALQQNGIAIDPKTRKQSLGAASLQPIMLLDPADLKLVPGKTGKSMIHADSLDFPTAGIDSPVMYQNSKFYFYYNTIMQAFYVMEVKDQDIRYVSMAGGNIYNQDGSCRPAYNPVGLKNGNDNTDLFLAYLNDNGYTQSIMKNSVNGLYQNFNNVEASFQANASLNGVSVSGNLMSADSVPYNQVNVVQMPRTQSIPPMPAIEDLNEFDVYWADTTAVYKVDPTYSWQRLTLLPLNMKDRSIMSPRASASLIDAQLIMKNGAVSNLVWNNNLYKATSTSGSTSTMVQVGNTSAVPFGLSLKKDSLTGINYYELVIAGVTYAYQIVFDALSQDQLTSYQYNAWKSETVADVKGNIILAEFLPGSGSASFNLPSASLGDVQNIPADQASKDAVTKGLTRVKKVTKSKVILDAKGNKSDDYQFLASVSAADNISYITDPGYVDLETGVLFDVKGIPAGISLKMMDLNSLLSSLSVSVSRGSDKVAGLVFRGARKSFVPSSSSSATASHAQAGVLGRVSGSSEKADSSWNFFGWVNSALSQLGSMVFGN